MRRRSFLVLLPLAACAEGALPPVEYARLPPGSVEGAGDPTRAAVLRASYAFANPATLANRPGAAAAAIIDMEYLAASLPTDPRYNQRDPLLPVRLRQARQEWRGVLGIPPEVPAQAVIDRMARIASDEQSGIPPRDDPALIARLATLPRLPRTVEAANSAAQVQLQTDQTRGGAGGRVRF
ncbi:hypothetical protein [Sabulicella glaciei]|uniref:Uncharacterized protein n=1 Tax=Sabulicella glaciei TaxID=2984948 RepID=A0ABT3NQX3_9PROT|nr:hypothetical protein [Roseococcus sp. MDT2-1-1]MCW8084552.1 hypothetical protein [Roseococcus sp. MDT2-1-1]